MVPRHNGTFTVTSEFTGTPNTFSWRKWAKISGSCTHLVCGLLLLSLDGLSRWYFCWPIKSIERPGTDGGLSFVTDWKERSVAAAMVFAHMGVVGTARWNACVCLYVTGKHQKTLNTHVELHTGAHLTTGQTPSNITGICSTHSCLNYSFSWVILLPRVYPAVFMLCSRVYTFTLSNQSEIICLF